MEQYFLEILNMSVIASLVIICVLVLRIILKKVPTVFSYLLWGIVFFRLLCPISFESAIGIFPSEIEAISTDVVISEGPNTTAETRTQEELQVVPNEEPQVEEFGPNEKPARVVSKLNFIAGAMYCWILGMIVFSGYSVLQLIKFKKKLVGATPLEKGIYLVDYIQTPFILGIIQPKIYLPTGLTMEEQEYIIAHERTHIVRLDNITRIFAFLALILHWFNPLVWVAYFLSEKDMELSCDEAVLKKMSESHQISYAKTLLHIATGRKIGLITPLAFGEGNPKERIENIMKYKKTTIWVSIILLCFIAVAIFVLGSNRMEKKEVIMGKTVYLEGFPVLDNTNWGMDVETTMNNLGIKEGDYTLVKDQYYPQIEECEIPDFEWNGWNGTLTLVFDNTTMLSDGTSPGLIGAEIVFEDQELNTKEKKGEVAAVLGVEAASATAAFSKSETPSADYEWDFYLSKMETLKPFESDVKIELGEGMEMVSDVIGSVRLGRNKEEHMHLFFNGRIASYYTKVAYRNTVQPPYGTYQFKELIHLSLASSSPQLEAQQIEDAIVKIEKDSFAVEYQNEKVIETEIEYAVEKMPTDTVEIFMDYGIDVSKYKEKYVYSMYRDDIKMKYEIYMLDDTIWISYSKEPQQTFQIGSIYSIYEVNKI